MATLELQVWELSTYEATLASKASQQQEEVADWERWDEDGFGAAALPRMAWQERSAGGGAAGGGGASGALLEVLVSTRGGVCRRGRGEDTASGAQGRMVELVGGRCRWRQRRMWGSAGGPGEGKGEGEDVGGGGERRRSVRGAEAQYLSCSLDKWGAALRRSQPTHN